MFNVGFAIHDDETGVCRRQGHFNNTLGFGAKSKVDINAVKLS